MDAKELLKKVGNYDSFFNLDELDKRAFEVSKKYGFEIDEVGKSGQGHPIYLIKAGQGPKNAFVWGFPHPNEPIGSMTIDWLVNYLGENKDFLNNLGYKWHFMYTADPDGTKLNEGWFKGEMDLKKFFLNYYRPAPKKQLEWTFPVKYKDFEWDKPMPETEVLMKIMDEIKPDLMYPLHNSCIGGAYFYLTQEFDDKYYTNIIEGTKELQIPLHLGEPECDFIKEIKKPFYLEFGFKDYYDYEVKLGREPKNVIEYGDNSASYLTRINPSAIAIVGEIPYFFDKEIINVKESDKTRRELWLEMLDMSDENLKLYSRVAPDILKGLKEPDLHYYVVENLQKISQVGNQGIKEYVKNSSEFDRKATYSEIFSCTVDFDFTSGLTLGQMRRAAQKAGNQEIVFELDKRIDEKVERINNFSDLKTFPIKKLVQLQLLQLFETLNYIERQS